MPSFFPAPRLFSRRDSWAFLFAIVSTAVLASAAPTFGQVFDISSFDATATGPWSDVALTTLTVPQVADGAVTLDGKPSNSEYGGFEGVEVTPGVNAWILSLVCFPT